MTALTPTQSVIFKAIKATELVKTFYWTGGTLLSYHFLHHRKSFDLDFFTEKPFSYDEFIPFTRELQSHLSIVKLSEKKIADRWEFLIDTGKDQTRCEFVYYNGDKKRLNPCTWFDGIMIDSLPDLAANKTMAYVDRNEVKDLLDVYTLLTHKKFTVQDLLAMVEKKFGASFSEFTFWSESAKSIKNLDSMRVYLFETDPIKQEEFLKRVKFFFLDKGKDFLTKHLG